MNSVGAGDSMLSGFMAKFIETKDYAASLKQRSRYRKRDSLLCRVPKIIYRRIITTSSGYKTVKVHEE